MGENVVSDRLRHLRAHLGFTQEELGRAVGVTRPTIASWEAGATSPTVAQLLQLARTLAVPVAVLVSDPDTEGVRILFRADDPMALPPERRAAVTRQVSDDAAVEDLAGEVPAVPPSRPLTGYDPSRVEDEAQ